MRYQADSYYGKFYETFNRRDGEKSYYSNMSFNGDEFRLMGNEFNISKRDIKEKVEELLRSYGIDLNTHSCKETDYGLVYERYVKGNDDDPDDFVIGTPDDYTNHEKFTIDIFYIYKDYGFFTKMND